MFRIYDPARHGTGPCTFRCVGRHLRFDHHVDSAADRGIYYAAPTLEGCVVEVFGDIGIVTLEGRRVGGSVLNRELLLLDLRGRGSLRAGTASGISAADHSLSQAWSRYWYEHPDVIGEIDGLIYPNAHNGADAIALYERSADGLECPPDRDWPLDDPAIDIAIREIAHENNLIVEET